MSAPLLILSRSFDTYSSVGEEKTAVYFYLTMPRCRGDAHTRYGHTRVHAPASPLAPRPTDDGRSHPLGPRRARHSTGRGVSKVIECGNRAAAMTRMTPPRDVSRSREKEAGLSRRSARRSETLAHESLVFRYTATRRSVRSRAGAPLIRTG